MERNVIFFDGGSVEWDYSEEGEKETKLCLNPIREEDRPLVADFYKVKPGDVAIIIPSREEVHGKLSRSVTRSPIMAIALVKSVFSPEKEEDADIAPFGIVVDLLIGSGKYGFDSGNGDDAAEFVENHPPISRKSYGSWWEKSDGLPFFAYLSADQVSPRTKHLVKFAVERKEFVLG